MNKNMVLVPACLAAALIALPGCQTGSGQHSNRSGTSNGGLAQGPFRSNNATARQPTPVQPLQPMMGSSGNPMMTSNPSTFPGPSTSPGIAPYNGSTSLGSYPANSNLNGSMSPYGSQPRTGVMPASGFGSGSSTGFGGSPATGYGTPMDSSSTGNGLTPSNGPILGTSGTTTRTTAPIFPVDMQPPPAPVPPYSSAPDLRN